MRVFLTGATGFIGSHIIPELLAAGHQVLGLTRSDAGARSLTAAGADVHRGDIEDLDSIRAGAAQCDAVIHTAFDHTFENFVANCEKDRRVITAIGDVLTGTDRPLLITSGVGIGDNGPDRPATEDTFNADYPNPRIASEETGQELLRHGVDVRVVRLPQVHDTVKQGLITPFVEMSREKGEVAYVGDGANRWSAAHVSDVARLYALVLDHGKKGARYNAVGEEGVTARSIAETVAAGLGVRAVSLPAAEAAAYFGWFGRFAALDMRASSAWTQSELSWTPSGPGLIADLEAMDYSTASAVA